MANTAATSPGTMANALAGGNYDWGTPDNAKTSNDSYATQSLTPGETSEYLKATNFGFSIPSATIDGILVEIERKDYYGEIKDLEVKIVKANGAIGTTNKADTVNGWPTTDTYKSYGGATDKWGETWTATDINDADFGVVLQVAGGDDAADVDHIRITVYYTEAAAGPANLKSYNTNLKANIKSINTNLIANVKSLDTNV